LPFVIILTFATVVIVVLVLVSDGDCKGRVTPPPPPPPSLLCRLEAVRQLAIAASRNELVVHVNASGLPPFFDDRRTVPPRL
jgi:hypothetical protein